MRREEPICDVYVALPYSHEDAEVREARFAAANRYCAGLLRRGVVAFSPISMGHPIARLLPESFGKFEKHAALDLAMVQRSRSLHVLCLEGWTESEGVQREFEEAVRYRREVVFMVEKAGGTFYPWKGDQAPYSETVRKAALGGGLRLLLERAA